MGNSSSQKITENQQILTTSTQIANSSCLITCNENIENMTLIIIGGTGDVTISQQCELSDVSCVMESSLDSNIDSILSAINSQSSEQSGVPIWDMPQNSRQTVDITQLITNSITQIQTASCEISANLTQNNNYIYIQDRNGDITLSQEIVISGATCNMTNNSSIIASSTTSSDSSQESIQKKGLGMFMMIIIILIIMGGIIMCVFLLTGGTKMIAKQKNDDKLNSNNMNNMNMGDINNMMGKSGGMGDVSSMMGKSGGMSSMGEVGSLVAANPEVLALV